MNDSVEQDGMLSPFRVLDLTDEKGSYCGKILADLGADVIKIEKPGGDPSRNIGPFYHDVPDPEKSLNWFALNRGKRGITLNIGTADGQNIFQRLVKDADFVIESFTPGYMDKLSLSYSILSQINQRIIMTSITPFGQTGPYKDYKAPDIVSMAMNGIMFMCGDADRPPVRITVDQAYLHAGAEAVIGSLMAHYYRELTGEGQHVDVSAQDVGTIVMLEAIPIWYLSKMLAGRGGDFRRMRQNYHFRQLWPCKDGFVAYLMMYGPSMRPMNEAMLKQMDSEGMSPDWLKQLNWDEFDLATQSQEQHDLSTAPFLEYFKAHTKRELYEISLKIGVPIMPLNSANEVLENEQLAGRDYWVEIQHPELATTIKYSGAFVKAMETPCKIWRRAPLIGEHNEEVYKGELGLSSKQLITLKECKII